MLTCHSDVQFLNFLQNELDVSQEYIAVAMKKSQLDKGPLPMLLWQYGLVTLEQLERIFDWLENRN